MAMLNNQMVYSIYIYRDSMVIQWHLMGFNGIYDDIPSGMYVSI